jgi:phosphatidate cytidylyltransferase
VLLIRVISSFVLIPLVILATVLGGIPFLVFALVGLTLAGIEYFQMAQRAGHRPQMFVGLALLALILIDTHFQLGQFREIVIGAAILTMVMGFFRRGEHWVTDWALTLAGPLYIGGTGLYMILLRAAPDGLSWTVVAFLTNWATDAAAFFVGTTWGRHGFFRDISPKKTWEGTLGAIIAATLAGFLCGLLFNLPPIYTTFMGLVVGIAGIIGDLAESLVKRQFGAKDSGGLIPGHGGMLDRIDSLLFVSVFAYSYLVWIVR